MTPRWSAAALRYFDACGFDVDYLSTSPPPIVAALEAAAERYQMQTTTAAFRYNVKRVDNHVCCRSNNLEHLCPACRRQAESCTCATCNAERAGSGASAPKTATNTAARTPDTVPPPPSLTARVLAMRGRHVEAPQPRQLASNGVPKPPSLMNHIRQLRRKGEPR